MSTELVLLELAIEVIWVTTVLYVVGHYLKGPLKEPEESYFIVEGYYKKGVFQKILICMLASVVIVATLYMITYLCLWILTMNGIKASTMYEARRILLLRC